MRYACWSLLASAVAGCSTVSGWFQPAEPRQAPPIVAPAETASQAEPTPPIVPRRDQAAITAAQWTPTVEFSAPERIESEAPKIMEESIKAGAVVGGLPLMACMLTYACPAPALLAGAALMVGGTAVGLLVGAGRVLAGGSFRTSPQPPALSQEEVEASRPLIHAAMTDTISQTMLHQCVVGKLIPTRGQSEPIQWIHEERTVSFAAVAAAGSPSQPAFDAYRSFAHDGYRYVIESFVSRIVMAPVGSPGQESLEVPARLVIEGGFRFLDLESVHEHERKLDWSSEPHTLREWRAGDGALLVETLRAGCDAMAVQIVSHAEQHWRNR